LPRIKNNAFFTQFIAVFTLSSGDIQAARKIYLSAVPGWTDPAQWPNLIEHYATHGCIVSWIFLNTGDEQLGRDLLAQTTAFLDQSLPAVREHVDTFAPEVCYLTAGDTEKALAMIETQLNHNHLDGWWWTQGLPMYDQLRFKPRYQAAVAEHERRVALQRDAIEAKNMEAGL